MYLTDTNGRVIFIPKNSVTGITEYIRCQYDEDSDAKTVVYTADGRSWYVTETFSQVTDTYEKVLPDKIRVLRIN